MWAMPCYGSIHPKVYRSHMAAMASTVKCGFKVVPMFMGVTNKTGLATAANILARSAIDLGVDYVFWTEMDMILPSDIIHRLFDHHADVCSGTYILRGQKDNPHVCAYLKYQGNNAKPYSFVPIRVVGLDKTYRVDAAGMGCLLTKTSVLRQLEDPWFDDREKECGQDMYFYTQLWRRNIPVWLDAGTWAEQIDEDEPLTMGRADYEKWVASHGKAPGGFIQNDETAYGKVVDPQPFVGSMEIKAR